AFERYTSLFSGGLFGSTKEAASSKIFNGILSIFATLVIKSLCCTLFLLVKSVIVNILRGILFSGIGKTSFLELFEENTLWVSGVFSMPLLYTNIAKMNTRFKSCT